MLLVALYVSVGQRVKQGQQLAIIEQNIDAAAQVNLLAEKNNVDAEFGAAKKEYERLQTIKDIASKKELSESEARFEKASENFVVKKLDLRTYIYYRNMPNSISAKVKMNNLILN